MATLWNRIGRVVRHAWLDESDLRQVIPPAMLDRLQQKISTSEQSHSGEIRICVEASLPWRALWRDAPMADIVRARAVTLFSEMGVWDTANNNGVLIYVLLAEHDIEILADRGLNALVGAQHWQALVNQMGAAFRQGKFEEGLSQGIDTVAIALRQHFPADGTQSNPNELPDRPVLR